MPVKPAVLKRYLRSFWRIQKEESEEETREEIMRDVSFKGANLWLLGFTMILACIGLNMDSIYALIGAMLMSPLLVPVFGLGFSLSTNNWPMFKHCAANWFLSLLISVAASTLYFLITPFSQPTAALTAFSHATIYDILIAFFGGLAAFVGLTRVSGMKVLAGVAVATACMPPLCTAGYGLANMDWEYLGGGLYFYIINCIYIGMAVMLLSRYMGYQKIITYSEKPLAAKIVYVLALVSLVPATIFAWQLVKEKRLMNNIDQYVMDNINSQNRTLLKKTVNLNKIPGEVHLYLGGTAMNEEEKKKIYQKMKEHHLEDLKLVIHTTPELEKIQAEPKLLKQLILKQEKKMIVQDSMIRQLSLRLDSLDNLDSDTE